MRWERVVNCLLKEFEIWRERVNGNNSPEDMIEFLAANGLLKKGLADATMFEIYGNVFENPFGKICKPLREGYIPPDSFQTINKKTREKAIKLAKRIREEYPRYVTFRRYLDIGEIEKENAGQENTEEV